MSPRTAATHDSFDRDPVARGSDRGFGFVFAAVFAGIGAIVLWKGGGAAWAWLGGSAVVLALALAAPAALGPFNRVWFLFGMALNRYVTNPLIMGVLFFLTVTPTGLILRAMNKDPLRLKRDPDAPTYWIERDPPGPEPKSMDRQF